MNREIKFRAWISVTKEMVKVEKIILDIPAITYTNSKGEKCLDSLKDNAFGIEIMQSTDLFDKSGNEIYEGDIIGINERYQILPKYIVEWNEKHCCFTCIDGGTFNYLGDIDESIQYHLLSNMRLNVCELIGNIYENSELEVGE